MRHHSEVGFSHLGGSALNLIGNLAAKVVTSAIKSGTAGQLAKQVGNNLLKDVKSQAVNMAHSHIDNLAESVQQKTGVKIDTADVKRAISDKAATIKMNNKSQYGGSRTYGRSRTSRRSEKYIQYGAGFPLALVGNLAGKLVNNVAKSGVANQLIKHAQTNAQSIAKDMISNAKGQAINISHSHIDNLAGEINRGLGVKIDTKDLKNAVSNKTNSFF
jgi:hypothetical protein